MGKFSGHVTRGPRWRALRALALSRDRHTCQDCGARGRLEVDHILPVKTHPWLAYDLENLRVLCGSCHTQKTNIEMGRVEMSLPRRQWRSAVRQLERHGQHMRKTNNA